jgi:N-acetylglucosaminyldiphosphoundecaprenol N-acetyl-beta-D-mannosaminyltransferase
VNPYSVFVANKDPSYVALLSRFDTVLADGVLMAKAASRIKNCSIQRVSFDGNSLAPEICHLAATKGLRLAIVGGVSGIADKAAEVFMSRYQMNIVATRDGFFDSLQSRQDYCIALTEIAPDIVICGMGAPYQEAFLADLANAGWKGVGFTCGGYLDQAAEGNICYYPEWVNRLNLRAPYRLFKDPKRLGKRYFQHYVPFYLSMVKIYLGWK